MHPRFIVAAAFLGLLPATVAAQSATALSDADVEAQQMGLQMAVACNPARHRLSMTSSSTIDREARPLAGTAVYFSNIDGTFIALEQYSESLEGHCLVFGWWGDELTPGTYPVTRLSMRTMEEQEMSDEHSFFSWGAVRTSDENSQIIVESGSITIDEIGPGRITGIFQLRGSSVAGGVRTEGVVWAGTFVGIEG